jgi:hypothetical protein
MHVPEFAHCSLLYISHGKAHERRNQALRFFLSDSLTHRPSQSEYQGQEANMISKEDGGATV